jgi:hypothetical protein
MQLTKKYKNELMNWHGGRGVCFFSCGDGKSYIKSDFGIISRNGFVVISIGTKSLRLDKEKSKRFLDIAFEDN